ncbi:hypothetical protein LTR85_006688 [Meristemomyces frigidus]|nr:hypothetical protein LTR85_006688 [Meristemomyces frigidus]
MAHTAAVTVANKECRLLALPPEMRNRIYRACLVEGDISIHSDDAGNDLPTEPAILRTCRQIRDEAESILYQENTFDFTVEDHDASNYVKWCRSAERRRECKHTFNLNEGSTNWSNLEKWMVAWWSGEAEGPAGYAEDEGGIMTFVGNVATHLFRVLETLQDSGLPWETAQSVLRNMRRALGVENQDWLEESDQAD